MAIVISIVVTVFIVWAADRFVTSATQDPDADLTDDEFFIKHCLQGD